MATSDVEPVRGDSVRALLRAWQRIASFTPCGALRRLGACLAAVVLAGLAGLAAPAAAFDLQGHRGARGLAPENSLAAFRAALALGVHTLELDVHVTRDGEVVITHDPRLNPAFTRDAQGRWIDEPGPAVI